MNPFSSTQTHLAPTALPLPRGVVLRFDHPLVMGILNVTPDSFSDGGRFDRVEPALEQARRMISEGADLLDIGGESTRPGAEPVSAEQELARVIPVIEQIRVESDIPISIDTYKATVAEKALDSGADIVNDIAALRFDPDLAPLVAQKNCPVILMHMLGEPRNMQKDPHYADCVGEIETFFEKRIAAAKAAGIGEEKIILDPGIGFGKRLQDNLAILANIERFRKTGRPVLIGASRKSFIKMIHDTGKQAEQRTGGSIAAALAAAWQAADILRVHDVAETVEALAVMRAIQGNR